ncbi:DUF6241 domain-containing protein [Paenibacillus sp. BSR1-1]|uniref:DUF6241 domain-containing protein n=1 Tax=Paenibacillus sp. BSR1-1 TaxID=3020845 RepID=UPI0025B0488A|nr:DUF6241 domain-containing protein [Paenibacillus sp. BSR1-1]MDN3019749.1 DUF6241 domain-containing protein [Paenibacillus sp. BSR1-1]
MKKYLSNLSRTQRIIILFAVLSLGFIYYFSKGALPIQKDAVTVKVQKTDEGESVIQIQDKNSEEIAKDFPSNMSEDDIRDAIHLMSHQKVVADKKWGAIPLTKKRVNRLLEVVKENQANYKNTDIYYSILKRWAKGDFSRVDEDHNEIWDLQEGTVGKAKRIASSKEERDFIEENFKVKQ